MDYFIIVVTTVAGLYFHWWIYIRIKRWVDRDLALSMAGDDPQRRAYMLEQLEAAKAAGIKRKALQAWLEQAASRYPQPPQAS